jgi:hypothetical protein
MYPPRRRRIVFDLYNDTGHQKNKTPLKGMSASKMNETASDTTNSTSKLITGSTIMDTTTTSALYPTPEQIPTAQEMQDLTDETE